VHSNVTISIYIFDKMAAAWPTLPQSWSFDNLPAGTSGHRRIVGRTVFSRYFDKKRYEL
jgi:hypothetical protein